MIKWIPILVAAAGLAVAIYTVSTASHEAPKVPLAAEPSVNPYAHGIAATGQAEGASRNIRVAAPEGAVATKVFVKVGQQVKAGDPLFELDPRPLLADLARARAARAVAEADLNRILAQPRAETLPALEAEVVSAESSVQDWQDQYNRYKEAQQQMGAGDMELTRSRFGLDLAKSRLARAKADLALAKAGAWGPDVDYARAQLASADAAIQSVQTMLDRRTVRAPVDGTILKRDIEPGQFAPADAKSSVITMADLSKLHIRARVDEEDLPELVEGAKATARIRGSRMIMIPLRMLWIEPLAAAKTELSGSTSERVDTRVVEVIFEVGDLGGNRLYPGQLVDVFIEGGKPGG